MPVLEVTPMFSQSLRYVLSTHPGPEPVYLRLTHTEHGERLLQLNYEVDGCPDLEFAVDVLTGAI